MKVVVGNKVKFINENLEGEIRTILSEKKVIVSCSDGFDYEVSLAEIVIIGENNELNYNVDEAEIASRIVPKQQSSGKSNFLKKYTNSSKYQMGRIVEVDLHLEQLVEFPNRLDDWQKLHTQMQHVKNCLGAATTKRVKKLVFIHGVGTGILKTELHNYLARFENLDFKQGDFNEYGSGATEVTIHY